MLVHYRGCTDFSIVSPEFVFVLYLFGIEESSDGVLCMDLNIGHVRPFFSMDVYDHLEKFSN